MSPQEAASLQPQDVVLYNSQLWRVAAVARGGAVVHLIGKLADATVPTRRGVELVYRAGADGEGIPPDTQLGHLTAEQEAGIRAVIRARQEREAREAADE